MKMRPAETVPGMETGIKENGGGVNSTVIYCKNFCKCHNGPQCSNNKLINKEKKFVFGGWGYSVTQCCSVCQACTTWVQSPALQNKRERERERERE
jgi:hypothetical protein